MVGDVGVGDRQDDPRPDAAVRERALEEAHVRAAVGLDLGVHAMVGGDPENRAAPVELPDQGIEPRVEAVRLGTAGWILVLDVVGCREVELIEAPGIEQPDPGLEAVDARLRVVDVRMGAPHQLAQVLDPVLGGGSGVGLLDRETDPAQVLAEQPPQLVLDRDRRHRLVGAAEGREDRRDAEVLGIVHRHFHVRRRVVVVVSADPVHVRGDTRDDRHVVRVRERWNDGPHLSLAAEIEDPPEVRHEVRRRAQVFARAAVQANGHDRP